MDLWSNSKENNVGNLLLITCRYRLPYAQH